MVIWGRWTVTMTWMLKHLWRIPVARPSSKHEILWRKGVQLFRVQTWRIRVEEHWSCTGDTLLRGITVIFPLPPVTSQLFNPYSKRVHWFINSGLKYIFWSGVFQKWLCYLDVSISNFAVSRGDITRTKSQHTSQNGNYFYCFPISLWVSMSKLSAHPISGGIGQDGLCHSVTVLVPTQLPGSRFDGDGQGQAATVTHHPVHTRHVG